VQESHRQLWGMSAVSKWEGEMSRGTVYLPPDQCRTIARSFYRVAQKVIHFSAYQILLGEFCYSFVLLLEMI